MESKKRFLLVIRVMLFISSLILFVFPNLNINDNLRYIILFALALLIVMTLFLNKRN